MGKLHWRRGGQSMRSNATTRRNKTTMKNRVVLVFSFISEIYFILTIQWIPSVESSRNETGMCEHRVYSAAIDFLCFSCVDLKMIIKKDWRQGLCFADDGNLPAFRPQQTSSIWQEVRELVASEWMDCDTAMAIGLRMHHSPKWHDVDIGRALCWLWQLVSMW